MKRSYAASTSSYAPAAKRRRYTRRRRVVARRSYGRYTAPATQHVAKCFDLAINGGQLPPYNTASWSIPSTPWSGMTSVNLVNQGAAVYQRVANAMTMYSLELDFVVNFASNPNAGTVSEYRVLVVYDAQPNGVQITMADILAESHGAAGNFFTQRNITQRMRFRTLTDKVFHLDAISRLGNHHHIYKKLPSLRAEFASNSTPMGSADITVGALYFVIIGLGVVNATFPSLNYAHARVRFHD